MLLCDLTVFVKSKLRTIITEINHNLQYMSGYVPLESHGILKKVRDARRSHILDFITLRGQP